LRKFYSKTSVACFKNTT